LAAAPRLIGIDRDTLWIDEIKTALSISFSPGDLIQERLESAHSPAFFLLMKVFCIPSDSIILLRLPAVFFGVATAVVGVFAGRALAGPKAGWIAGLLLALTPALVDYAQDARP
jgi:mannosyltransferase